MRTTVTIDEPVERLLRKAMHERHQSFKQVLNDALRKGLIDLDERDDDEPFQVIAHAMGLRAGFDPGRLNTLVDELDADAHINLTRQLASDGNIT